MVGDTGILLSEVIYIKQGEHDEFLIIDAGADVPRIGFFQIIHQIDRPLGPGNDKGSLAPRPGCAKPAAKPQIGNAHHMIRMQMGQEHMIDLAQRNLLLKQPLCDAASDVKQQLLINLP